MIQELGHLARLALRQRVAPAQNAVFGAGGSRGCKPSQVNLEVINRCCLRCSMCDIWKNHDGEELTAEQWCSLLDDLVGWLGSFRLTVTGGEPFMKTGIWPILDHAVALRLPVIVVTNGVCFTERTLKRLLRTRLSQVVVSIDAPDAAGHDRVRGVPGAYEKTIRMVRALAPSPRSFVLASNTVVTAMNIAHLGPMAMQLASMGIERLLFQPIQGGFSGHGPEWPYDSELWPDAGSVDAGIDGLLEAQRIGAPVANTAREVEHFRAWLSEGPGWSRPWPCRVKYTTFHCDAYGHVRMCVPYAGNVGNVLVSKPAEIWAGALATRERDAISSCDKPCMLSCNRRYGLREQVTYAARLAHQQTR